MATRNRVTRNVDLLGANENCVKAPRRTCGKSTPLQNKQSAGVGMVREDMALALSELGVIFDEMLDAETELEGPERDACVLGVLRRLRTVQCILGSATFDIHPAVAS